jgi:SSS family transporter
MFLRITALLTLSSISLLAAEDKLEWKALPDLPGDLGVAGPFAGVHNDGLIIAGGANFPDGEPWRPTAEGFNSPKVYYDTINVVTKAGKDYKITEAKAKLPRALGYGVSISTDGGVLCIGGEWRENGDTHRSAKVFALSQVGGQVTIDEDFPPLPAATTAAAGALVGNIVYVAGGDSGEGAANNFWALDLAKRGTDDFSWVALPPWDGPARTHLLASAQNDGGTDCLYIFSGRMKDSTGRWHMLSDAHKFNPKTGEWEPIRDIQPSGDAQPRCVMAGTVAPIGANQLLVFGGANGKRFVTLTGLGKQIAAAEAAGNKEAAATLKAEQQKIQDTHIGFSRDVLLYNTVTDRWTRFAEFPEDSRAATAPGATERVVIGSHVTTTAVQWDGSIIIPSGESSPGIRTPNIWSVTLDRTGLSFGTLNWTVLGAYMAVLMAMGVWLLRRGKTADDFFLAGRRIPWWAAGLSIYSTMLSAITYLAIPAKTYATDWTRFLLNCGILAIAPLVIVFFLPFYRRLNITSIYEFLEKRFSPGLRLVGSASFVMFQLARMGIVILLPALALSAVTGLDVRVCILAMGIFCTAYTVMGGIEAVIWTDVLQTIVLLGGALVAVFIIIGEIDGGLGTILAEASAQNKFNWANFRWDWSNNMDAIGVILVAAIFTNLLPYTTDQAVVQRYLTTPDEKQAARAIWTNGLMAIPGSVVFFGLGTALFVFFQQHPAELEPLANGNQILPYFIVTQMPAGVAGLVIAGVFAAAMSSLDSSMHSIATAVTTDFFGRLKLTPEKRLLVARWLTLALGVLGTVSALIIERHDVGNLWDQFMDSMGLILGTLGGLFSLGIFTRRVGSLHAWIGVLISAFTLWFLKNHSQLHGLLFGAIGTLTCFVIGLAASYALPAKPKNLDGLIWATRNKTLPPT